MLRSLIIVAIIGLTLAQFDDISGRTVVIRLEPQPVTPNFMKEVEAPHAVQKPIQQPSPVSTPVNRPEAPVQIPASVKTQAQFPGASPPGIPPAIAQQPTFKGENGQQFAQATVNSATPPPPPPVNIPPDVQNQLIKFFGLDSFGIPGLTGNHPNGFAGAIQELRAAGIPVQGIPAEHVGGQTVRAPQSDVLSNANPAFANDFNNLADSTRGGIFHSSSNVPLPDAKPGENGLIGLLSTSIRKIVKDCK